MHCGGAVKRGHAHARHSAGMPFVASDILRPALDPKLPSKHTHAPRDQPSQEPALDHKHTDARVVGTDGERHNWLATMEIISHSKPVPQKKDRRRMETFTHPLARSPNIRIASASTGTLTLSAPPPTNARHAAAFSVGLAPPVMTQNDGRSSSSSQVSSRRPPLLDSSL